MALFKSNNINDFTDTCKFWKIAHKSKHIQDYYIGYTSGSNHCCALDENDRYLFNHYQSLYITEFVINNGGWDNCNIELLEECPWQNRQHAESRQKELVASLPHATHNHCKRCRTKKEEQLLAENRKERQQQYEIDNYDIIKARRTKLIMCDVCGSQFQQGGKAKHIKTTKHQLAQQNTHADTDPKN